MQCDDVICEYVEQIFVVQVMCEVCFVVVDDVIDNNGVLDVIVLDVVCLYVYYLQFVLQFVLQEKL